MKRSRIRNFRVGGPLGKWAVPALAAAVGVGVAASAQAAELAEYTFTSGRASSDGNVLSTASNFSDVGFSSLSINTERGNPAPAIEVSAQEVEGMDEYFTFTVTPDTGLRIDPGSIDLQFSVHRSQSSGYHSTVVARTSLDDFGTDLIREEEQGESGGDFATAFTPTYSGDLSGAAPTSDPVEVRIYFDEKSGSIDKSDLLDNVVFQGSVIPEPASLALLGLGGLAMLGRRRRRS